MARNSLNEILPADVLCPPIAALPEMRAVGTCDLCGFFYYECERSSSDDYKFCLCTREGGVAGIDLVWFWLGLDGGK